LATRGLAVPEGSTPPPGNLSAPSWVVADLDTGAVIGACGPHEYGAPASVQKLLLAATVMPKLNPADTVTITQEDLNFEPGSSAVGLILGGKYPVETIWLGLMLNSGNDAANTLARLGGGDRGIPGTLADMNAEAKHLGAYDTHAATPSGLDGPGQVTSAYDLALIARACFAREDFRKYVGSRTAQMPPEPPKAPKGYQIQNDNRLLFEYPGAMGGKTGFTDLARHTFVGAAERDGRRLVVTILGAEQQPVRTWQQGAALLNWGFAVPKGSTVGTLVKPGEADRPAIDPAAAAAAGPSAVPVAGPAALGTPISRTAVIVGVGAAAAVFIAVWLAVALAFRRRRVRRRTLAPTRSSTVGASDFGR
jgi:D-alanyl-D-alanine carboxypeptidase (penicillin-binding protein 5/6)